MVELTAALDPGLYRQRDLLLLHQAQVTRAQRRHAAGAPPKHQLAALETAGRHVEGAFSLLGQEPASTPERGPILQLARATLQGCYELAESPRPLGRSGFTGRPGPRPKRFVLVFSV